MNKMGFFEESPGQLSGTRLVFIVGSFWAMALTTYIAVTTPVSPMELAGMFGAFGGTLGAIKVSQKAFESKPEIPEIK